MNENIVPTWSTIFHPIGANVSYEDIVALGISTQRGTFLNFDK